MARTRALQDLITDTQRLADLENASTRFSTSELTEYVNKSIAYVYRHIITVMDRPFYQSDYVFATTGTPAANPAPGTLAASIYPLPADFLQLLSVQWATTLAGPWIGLDPYEEAERPTLINSGYYGAMWPSKYGIVGGLGAFNQGTIPTAYSMEILPQPPASSFVLVRYVPSCPRLTNLTDTFDGILGFEDAVSTWAAILMRRKDDLPTVELESDMARHLSEISLIAKRRDRSRPPKVQVIRQRYSGRRWRRWMP